jgi:hypothetical protein
MVQGGWNKMNHDWIYLDAIKCVLRTRQNMWHWLCENHPQIALEYEASIENDTLLADRQVYNQHRESINNKGGKHHE